MKSFFFIFLLVGLGLQAKTITGTVTDEQNRGLPGVNIIIKGTATGTQTDFDGKYSIQAEAGDVLVFSYIGYKTR